ncbi:hypothetical protein [Pseudomonas chlororaphis]|uniref:hypothetical protein n=1 Tax=Pseudomonas chlororaphis TaxID=587753 RepID=UPI002366657E|nr:hypothetical protein [Pseudomonas chlororaphis]WDH20647.1 hypothetical protein PUP50_21880 [Pseudomonas chlororaphis]
MKSNRKIYAYAISLPSILVALTGCPSNPTSTGGEVYNWKTMNPPRENALGKEIYRDGVVGEQIISAEPANIERSGSISSLSKEDYRQASAQLEATIVKLSADINASHVKSEKITANDWQITQIKKFINELPVDRAFVYQCLSAKENKFELESKAGGGVSLDATKTEIAKNLGIEAAKVEIKSNPDKPDKLEVTISNPNICISYKSARFIDDNDYITGSLSDKHVDITGDDNKYSTTFTLEPGQKSNWRTPQFIGREPAHKPLYRLMAVKNETSLKTSLAVCRQDKGTGGNGYTCTEIEDDGYGNWDRPYHIDTFSYGEKKYKVVYLNIKAKLKDGKVLVKSAQLQYPQYLLVIK